MGSNITLAESLPQGLREPLGHGELQGLTALCSSRHYKENCGSKTEPRESGLGPAPCDSQALIPPTQPCLLQVPG